LAPCQLSSWVIFFFWQERKSQIPRLQHEILLPFNHQVRVSGNGQTKVKLINFDGFVKSRHSRAGGNPEPANRMKRLDSRFHGNDEKADLRIFYEIINFDGPLFRNDGGPVWLCLFCFDILKSG
jgi:hypothetical protein